jgi:hypothetical protein
MLRRFQLAIPKMPPIYNPIEQAFELQTDWVKLGKYPLPSKKYVTDDAKSMNLTIPISKDDDNYRVFSAVDDNLSKLSISQI